MKKAVYTGTFDPITNGHLDIITRASGLFAQLVVAVGHNPEKSDVFTADERVEMIENLVTKIPNVSVAAYEGLTARFVKDIKADVIVRGIRDTTDLREELQAANTNRLIGGVETIFLMASEQFALTSSTLIKQIVEIGGEVSARLDALIPAPVLSRLQDKVRESGG